MDGNDNEKKSPRFRPSQSLAWWVLYMHACQHATNIFEVMKGYVLEEAAFQRKRSATPFIFLFLF